MPVTEGVLEEDTSILLEDGEVVTRNVYQKFDRESPLHDADNLGFIQPVIRYVKIDCWEWKVVRIRDRNKWRKDRETVKRKAKWKVTQKLRKYC